MLTAAPLIDLKRELLARILVPFKRTTSGELRYFVITAPCSLVEWTIIEHLTKKIQRGAEDVNYMLNILRAWPSKLHLAAFQVTVVDVEQHFQFEYAESKSTLSMKCPLDRCLVLRLFIRSG